MAVRWNSTRRPQLCVLLALAFCVGCEIKNTEFIMRDRPTMTEMRGDKAVPYYLVHVGDTPSLAFRSKLYFCDYAIMHNSTTDTYEDCGPDLGGSFEWPYRFTTITPPGELTALHVKAYQSMGKRDFMPYKGKIMEIEVGNDPDDDVAAEAEILVRVYQSRLEIPVDMGGKEPMWHAARLEMEGRGVRRRRILHSSEARPGHFQVEGPDGLGRFKVVYEPTIKDIDPTGVTTAVLKVPDVDAQMHEFTAEMRPPSAGADTSPTNTDDEASGAGMTPMSMRGARSLPWERGNPWSRDSLGAALLESSGTRCEDVLLAGCA